MPRWIHTLQEKMNHSIYIDDIKQSAKNEKKLETLIQAARIYSKNVVMEFSIEKCAVKIMRSVKRQITEGIELPNLQKKKKIRTLGEKETHQY